MYITLEKICKYVFIIFNKEHYVHEQYDWCFCRDLFICMSIFIDLSVFLLLLPPLYFIQYYTFSAACWVLFQSLLSTPITSHFWADETLWKRCLLTHLTHKNALHLIQNANVLPHRVFLLCFLVSSFKRRHTFVLPFHLPFFSALLIFTLPLNCCVFVVVSVCPSICLRELGTWRSIVDILKKLLMRTFLFVYQVFTTLFYLL